MHPLFAIFLGIVQGITEFLPISSSGHLALLEHYLKLPGAGLSFDILLHLGTLAALLAYFGRDWLAMGRSLVRPSFQNQEERYLFLYLVVASIPGALAGVLLEQKAETLFREPWRIALLLGSVGLLLLVGERVARHHRAFSRLTIFDAVLIGLSQGLAIMPGVSRSGITMTCALFLGFTREASARFSFLLATPIIAGAGLHHLPKWLKAPPEDLSVTAASLGFLAALISSYLTIKYLLRFLQRHTFKPFAYYRLLLAALILILVFFRIGA
ncbi:MAG: undecaprenyl-diphosphatase UppP [Deltaproteobacteria bacterium]|nr:undecaprenyl-diphosphatase UppP [Deltaproteobacteria bacterium]MBI4795664.1 undecaprenyl-diphosphatase UppP [Deltaproteobacteria bacterium]